MTEQQVFLSASYPLESRNDEYTTGPNNQDVGLAVSAVAEGVLGRECRLLFGGHPSISPVVRNVATTLGRRDLITVVQSRFFEKQITHDVERLWGQFRGESYRGDPAHELWTNAVESSASEEQRKRESLEVMRETAFAQPLAACFFVGGMAGVSAEFDAAMTAPSQPLLFLFTKPGGKSADIAKEHESRGVLPVEPLAGDRLFALNGRGYLALVMQALRHIDTTA